MELKTFIKELGKISNSIDNSDKVEIEMVDCIPVVGPIFKDCTVFITEKHKYHP